MFLIPTFGEDNLLDGSGSSISMDEFYVVNDARIELWNEVA